MTADGLRRKFLVSCDTNWDKYGGTTSPCATIKFYYAPMFNAPWRNWKSLAFLEQILSPQNCFATFRYHCRSEVDEDVLEGKWKLIKCQEIKSVESTKLLSSVSGVEVEHRRNRKKNFTNLTFLSTWQRHSRWHSDRLSYLVESFLA